MSALRRFLAAALVSAACVTPGTASEIITHIYDARGRLVKVAHSDTVNNGTTACYSYDKADNRTNVTVATSSDCSASKGTFSISSNAPVTEGAGSVFTITKAGSAAASVSVNYATSNGTAAAPGDFTAKSGTLTFTTKQTSQTVTVSTVEDTAVEAAETFTMSLASPTGGATIATGTATATINDNDSAGGTVSFAVSDSTAVEGNQLAFTVTKTGSTSSTIIVSFATSNGTALAGYDYVATSGTLSFAPADTSKTAYVTTFADSPIEAPETMKLDLSGTGVTFSDSQGLGTIIDQCSQIESLSAGAGTVTEGLDASTVDKHSGNTEESVAQASPTCP